MGIPITGLWILLTKALQLLLALSLLVFIHELGHFLFARLFGVRVDKFFLFFDIQGKALWRFRPKGSQTEYGIGWLPLGGYCKIHGMIDESLDSSWVGREPKSDEFRSKHPWQRFLILFGGVLFNFILALLIYTGISYHWGDDQLSTRHITAGMIFSPTAQEVGFVDGDILWAIDGVEPDALHPKFMRSLLQAKVVTVQRDGVLIDLDIPRDMMRRIIRDQSGFLSIQVPFVVDSVIAQGPADIAGFRPGDQLCALDSTATPSILDARRYLQLHPCEALSAIVLRGSDTLHTTLRPDSTGLVGILLRPMNQIYSIEHISYSIGESLLVGWQKGITTLSGYASDMKLLFTPEGATSVGGLISMGQIFPANWDWYAFWQISALLSIIFAFMNLLPIPGLDGGHILFVLWELITGRKVPQKILLRAQLIGMGLLFALIFYANANDIIKLF